MRRIRGQDRKARGAYCGTTGTDEMQIFVGYIPQTVRFIPTPKKTVFWLSIFPVVKTNGGRGTFGVGWICASLVQEPFDYGSMAALRRQHQGCPTQLGARTHSDAFSFLSGTTMPRRKDAARPLLDSQWLVWFGRAEPKR